MDVIIHINMFPVPAEMAGLNFALLFLSLTTRFYPPSINVTGKIRCQTEDLGYYASTDIDFLPKNDLILDNLLRKGNGSYDLQNGEPKGKTVFIFLNILICGDIAANPCPPKYPCGSCTKAVRSNQKAIMCDECQFWFHINCMSMTVNTYNELAQNDNEWYCNGCSLPKFSESFLENCDDADIVDQIQPDEIFMSKYQLRLM